LLQTEEMAAIVQAALERSAEVNLHNSQIRLAVQDARLVMTGEVPDIVAKRAAHLTAVRLLGADRVVDKLCVKPVVQRSDAEIAAFLQDMIIQERAFRDYPLHVVAGSATSPPAGGAAPVGGEITLSVSDAVVTLAGTVGSLTHRRLADVLAWWSPGVRAVHNLLHVVPEQVDNDAELCDALRIVLEKDPSLDAGAIGVQVKARVVTLQGTVSSEAQRRMALQDAWYILGVHGVDNRIQVR
jgi:osmotically-inducible protein OsmY